MSKSRHSSTRSGQAPSRRARVLTAAGSALALTVAGCATYHPLPLPQHGDLAARIEQLRNTWPTQAGATAHVIDLQGSVSVDDLGLLAILNDPDLRSQRGALDSAAADLLQASLLPNPSAGVGWSQFLSGGSVDGWTLSLSEDIAALVTYRRRHEAARFTFDEAKSNLVWDQWQVAQKARLLGIDIYWNARSLQLSMQERDVLQHEIEQVQSAVGAGNLDNTVLAPLLAAKATLDQTYHGLELDQLSNWQQLDALLGLLPNVTFEIAEPQPPPAPQDLEASIQSLPQRRPDLVALQFGYRSADASVRAAILGQFPAFVLGGTWSRDTTNVQSIGVNATFDLPIFNRNQGGVRQARADREQLQQEYQARLDAAEGDARALQLHAEHVAANITEAEQTRTSAQQILHAARDAYAQGNLDQRSLADFETAALDRDLDAATLERSLGEDRVTLAVDLGLGLPQSIPVPPASAAPQSLPSRPIASSNPSASPQSEPML